MAEQNRTSRRRPPVPTRSSNARPNSAERKCRTDAERVLRLTEVEARTGLFKSTLYEMIARNQFPAPFPIGARAVGWLDSEITNWIVERAAARRGASDTQAGRIRRKKRSHPTTNATPVEV